MRRADGGAACACRIFRLSAAISNLTCNLSGVIYADMHKLIFQMHIREDNSKYNIKKLFFVE